MVLHYFLLLIGVSQPISFCNILKSCASLCPSHRYQFVWELVNADLRLTVHDIISGTRCPRDAPASRQYSNFFVAFFGILFASRFLLHDLDVLDK